MPISQERRFAAKARDLKRAISENDHDSVEVLLEEFPSLRFVPLNQDRASALHHVVYSPYADTKMAEIVLGSRGDTLLLDKDNNSPLNLACIIGRMDIANFLVSRDYFIDHRAKDGSILHYAVLYKDYILLQSLISKRATNFTNNYGYSPIDIAFDIRDNISYQILQETNIPNVSRHEVEFSEVLSSVINPNLYETREELKEDQSMLDLSEEERRKFKESRKEKKVVRKVLNSIIDDVEERIKQDEERKLKEENDLRNKKQNMVGGVAKLSEKIARKSSDNALSFFDDLEKQAKELKDKEEIEKKKNLKKQRKKLRKLIKSEVTESLEYEIEETIFDDLKELSLFLGASIDFGDRENINLNAKDKSGNNIIHYLTNFCDNDKKEEIFEAINMLVENGAELNSTNHNGHSALFLACNFGNEEMVKFLLEHGADITLKDKQDSSVLHFAAKEGNKEVVEILLKHSESKEIINSRNKDGNTPYHYACGCQNEEVINLLLDNGADFVIANAKQEIAVKLIKDLELKKKVILKQIRSGQNPSPETQKTFVLPVIQKNIESNSI
ncbi:MAG: hypothetical protein FJ368_04735 [Pelagibacterales bacterium]|nr:hypothetical protein [Pelagibacterales bacterium]